MIARDLGRRLARATLLGALALATSAAASPAAVTIGQTGPAAACAGDDTDYLQPSVTDGNPYVVPATVPNWTLTSWSTDPTLIGDRLAMKVFRPLGGLDYMVVGHEGPHELAGSAMNTFPASLAVKAGDVLGLSTPAPGALCQFVALGESFLQRGGNLADGGSGTFSDGINYRLDVSAVVTPTNSFTLGALARNRRKGTATMSANVPNPGTLELSSRGLRPHSIAAGAPGEVGLTLRANGRTKRRLRRRGKVRVTATVTFTPTGGEPRAEPLVAKLVKGKRK